MKPLATLLAGLEGVVASGPLDAPITAIAADSRTVRAGALCALLARQPELAAHHASDALARGAAALLGQAPRPAALPATVAYLETAHPRRVLAEICRVFFDAPDRRLRLVGVTGTNGKTTTTHLVAAAFEAAGVRCAIGGTNGQRIDDERRAWPLTTPESPQLWQFLADAVAAGCGAAAIEVSSAALIADRTHAMEFAAAVLTGMGHDHLDLHGSFEAYRAAKLLLFERLPADAVAVLPADDPELPHFARAAGAIRTTSFGESGSPAWRLADHAPDAAGASFRLTGPGFDELVRTHRPGLWDARNLAAAVAATTALGIPAAQAVAGAAALATVDGRWEPVDAGQPYAALVDYAHTPEALERTLTLLRRVTRGRVIVVFGCGGDRDREKRPAMGRIAGELADVAFVTEDNPRSEDPEAIAAAILEGFAGTACKVERVAGRAAAIRAAVSVAREGDAVLVTGKGHETYQEIAGHRFAFDDRLELRTALAADRAVR